MLLSDGPRSGHVSPEAAMFRTDPEAAMFRTDPEAAMFRTDSEAAMFRTDPPLDAPGSPTITKHVV